MQLTYSTRDEAVQAIVEAIEAGDATRHEYNVEAVADTMVQRFVPEQGNPAYYLAYYEYDLVQDTGELAHALQHDEDHIRAAFWSAVQDARKGA